MSAPPVDPSVARSAHRPDPLEPDAPERPMPGPPHPGEPPEPPDPLPELGRGRRRGAPGQRCPAVYAKIADTSCVPSPARRAACIWLRTSAASGTGRSSSCASARK